MRCRVCFEERETDKDAFCRECRNLCRECLSRKGTIVKLLLVNHEYVCEACGVVSRNLLVDNLASRGAVAFRDLEQMNKQAVVDDDGRRDEIWAWANHVMDQIHELSHYNTELRASLESRVMQLIKLCLAHSPQVRRSAPPDYSFDRFILPKDREIVAVAVVILALENMRQFLGNTFSVLDRYPEDVQKRVLRFKSRMESSSVLDLNMANYTDRVFARIVCMCNNIGLPFKLVDRIQARFKEIIRTVLMNGKNTSHLAASVIVHSCDGCKLFSDVDIKLTQSQIGTLCGSVGVKPRALASHVRQLHKKCCYTPPPPPPPTSRKRARPKKTSTDE